MATPATALLADFDFNLTQATPPIPRPPTPDPRRTPTPHPPRRPTSSLPGEGRRRLHKKPTAIFVGSEPTGQAPVHEPCPLPFLDFDHPSHRTLLSLLPLLPSTPSPRFATSPSLSSGGTTVQSSPTLTPTTGYFASSYSEPPSDTKALDASSTWDYNQGKFGLRRAKRLPHHEQGVWEVHAVVHVSKDSKGCGSSSGTGQGKERERPQHQHYEWCLQQQRHSGVLASSLPQESDTKNSATTDTPSAQCKTSANRNDITARDAEFGRPHGVYTQSWKRERHLTKTNTGETSSFTLSKYHFPAPPGNYRSGLDSDLDHPAKVHYRGASFDLVNPHASLLSSSSPLETPAEIDGLLDNYFEDQDTMRRALYTDAETARRDILRLDGAVEAAQGNTSSHGTSESSLVPTRVPSDPFNLRITDVPSQAVQPVHDSSDRESDLENIVGDYEYTRNAPFDHDATLRVLESGLQESHSEVVFRQLPHEVQQHMSAELSEQPTSDRTYGETGQLLGLTPTYGGQDARMRPAPGRSTTDTTIRESGLRSAAASLYGADTIFGSPDSRSTQRARGETQVHADYREMSSNTLQSDDEGDWETTRSESRVGTLSGVPRPSISSYANTSTYNEDNRLSVMSDATIAGKHSHRPYRVAHTLPLSAGGNNDEDVKRARKALEKIYKDKVLDQSTIAGMLGHERGSREPRSRDHGMFQGLRDRRKSAILQAHDNDIELEEIRKKNPQAVRLAADQLFTENNRPHQLTPQRGPMPMDRLRGVFSRNRPTAEQIMNRSIMNEAIAEEDSRNLLNHTPTTVATSRLAFSESANTFRTFRDDELMSLPLERDSRTALDLGGRSFSPAIPAAVHTPDSGRVRRTLNMLESHHRERGNTPYRPARRAAMSSQTSLRALITAGSPTSNIQGAFTDREMAEASRRWDLLPRRHNYRHQYHSRNASGPFPRLHNSPVRRTNVEGRMLLRPSDVIDPETQLLQEKLSKRYLMSRLGCPPLTFLYYLGHYDHLIEAKTNGRVKEMSPARKEDALIWSVLVAIAYILIITMVITVVAVLKAR